MARRSSAMWLASIERYIDPSMEDIFQTKKEAIVMYSLRKGRVQSVACKACLFVCLHNHQRRSAFLRSCQLNLEIGLIF